VGGEYSWSFSFLAGKGGSGYHRRTVRGGAGHRGSGRGACQLPDALDQEGSRLQLQPKSFAAGFRTERRPARRKRQWTGNGATTRVNRGTAVRIFALYRIALRPSRDSLLGYGSFMGGGVSWNWRSPQGGFLEGLERSGATFRTPRSGLRNWFQLGMTGPPYCLPRSGYCTESRRRVEPGT